MLNPIKFYLTRRLNLFAICCAASILSFGLPGAFAAQNWQECLQQGNDYLNQNAIPKAKKCFAEAVNKMDSAPHTVEDKIQCLNELANTYALQNKTSSAKFTYEKSLNLEIAKIPSDQTNSSKIAVSSNNIKQSGKPGHSRRI